MLKQKQDQLDETELKFDVEWIRTQRQLTAWVANMKVITTIDESEKEFTALLVYVITEEGIIFLQLGQSYKLIYDLPPYFYVECKDLVSEVAMHLENQYEKHVLKVEIIDRIDLNEINHLKGISKKFIKLSFRTISDLLYVRNQLRYVIERNSKRQEDSIFKGFNLMENVNGLREYDVPYHCRVCIDTGLRCCKWFNFVLKDRKIAEINQSELQRLPDLRFMAFDIETMKQPLKFPDSKSDQIMMISITHSSNSILITNMKYLGQEVEPFKYNPPKKDEFASYTIVFNEPDEKSLLLRFFAAIIDYKPLIISSFNGDKFDWPFIEERCLRNGFYLENEIGIKRNEESNEYYGRFIIHMDCFAWVERDAYLPQGSHGLKAVTRAKLGYEPVEVDPEKMVPMAQLESQKFAEYSISDSVATYWLYRKHIHDFILALCTIIPLSPDEVLRKGSGTLCECLLMAQAFERHIVFPNKTLSQPEKFQDGHLIDTETYIGGKVECLRSGIYRSDIDVEFKLDKACMQSMWNGVHRLIKFVGKIENQTFSDEEVENCVNAIRQRLDSLMTRGEVFKEKPLIYHLDVAAMYPNIILTNRLQPVSIVDNKICSNCVFNSPENECKRPLEWQWKGEVYPLQRNEFEYLKQQLEREQIEKSQKELAQQLAKMRLEGGGDTKKLHLKGLSDLPQDQQQKLIKQRVKLYCQKTYKTVHQHVTILRKDTVCMRENDFYVQTVRDFRDRRYEFKELVKIYKGKLEQAKKEGGNVKECHDMMALYESLQLAHKIILNSFYGYVMRKGARWYSMAMAGIVTHMGSQIISTAKQWVDQIGLPLELDTDGIWCLLPSGFPEDFFIKCESGKNLKFSYPCYILNELVHERYKNNQYQWLKDEKTLDYEIRSEMSIFFEVDGPYRCMIIPAAREENKQLKKRYVVFNKNGSIAEIKGFEIKRRGELQIIKQFQQNLFSEFLKGTNLQECYAACASVAQKLLQILVTGGKDHPDSYILELIGESRVLSRELSDYDTQKGVAITAGRRIVEYLGSDQMRGGGLNCSYIITKLPHNTPVNERSIPVLIFEASLEIKRKFLRRWLKEPQLQEEEMTLAKIVDWNYYIERLSNTVQKLLVIPAVLQKLANPVPEVIPPEWLNKRIREQESGLLQSKIENYFQQINKLAKKFDSIRFQPTNNANVATPIKDEVQQNPYNMELDFQKFLKFQKQIWSKEYRNKQNNVGVGRGNLKNMIKQGQYQLLTSVWQILQLYEAEPGLFNVFILLENGALTQQMIRVKRTIYVNSYVKVPGYTLVKKTLPRGKQVHQLHSITIEEEEFLKEYLGFNSFEANPDTEGIYEQNIPLIFKIITELGCMCKINRQEVRTQKSIYSLEDLQPVYELSNKELYLEKQQNSLFFQSYIILHHQLQDNYAVWTLVINEEMLIIVVRKSDEKQNKQDLNQYIKSVQDQIEFKRKQLRDTKVPLPERIKIQLVKDDKLAIDYITNHYESRGQQTKLCILYSNKEVDNLQNQGLNFLCLKIATLCVPSKITLARREFQWDFNIIKSQLEEYCFLPEQLINYIEHSRYATMPLCNLTSSHLGKKGIFKSESEKLSYITDVLFQRTLRLQTTTLSWYGSGLGRDNRDLIPTQFMNTHFENPGIYIDFTAEIDILHFSINTIAQSDELQNMDRETSTLIGQNGRPEMLENLDELVGARTPFKLLKFLVQGWLKHIYSDENLASDNLIQNINCWVYSGQSQLYDPYLGKMLQRLNFKMFSILTNKLQQLGAKIVYASPSKLLISTGKQKIESAIGYVQYITETLQQQSLFKYITFTPQKYFTTLIYKNKNNYLGCACTAETTSINYDFKLKLIDFLPKNLQYLYEKFLFEILHIAEDYKTQSIASMKNFPNNIRILKMENLAQDAIVHIIKQIEDYFSQKMYDAIEMYNNSYREDKKNYEIYLEQEKTMEVEQLNVKKNRRIIEDEEEEEVEDEDYEQDSFVVSDHDHREEEQMSELVCEADGKVENFPKNWCTEPIPGATMKQNDQPILRTVVYICAMLSVDEEVHQIMKRIKTNCCKILKLSEHSKEVNYTFMQAEFKDPYMEMTIQNVTCFDCYIVSDLSIFKDDWACEGCGKKYDQAAIEYKICQYVEQQILFYQIQDLYCIKCKQTQNYQFQERCTCAASFQLRNDQFEECFIKNSAQLLSSLSQMAIQKNLLGLQTLLSSIQY